LYCAVVDIITASKYPTKLLPVPLSICNYMREPQGKTSQKKQKKKAKVKWSDSITGLSGGLCDTKNG
jgi:hypothetical protein